MFGSKVRDSNQRQVAMKCPKINIINKEGMVEPDCPSPIDCDEVGTNTVTPVPDTVWKIGCYKINPSTPSGNIYFTPRL
jgi:hypothetical protein